MLLAWMFLFATPAVGESGNRARRNLILISIDTLRADHTSAYGYKRETTPGLVKLARTGTLFEVAYAPTSSTAPTHATIFTGTHPARHGLIMNGLSLSAETPTLAEILSAEGYQTAAIVSSFVLDRRFGFAAGFSTYQDDFDPATDTTAIEEWQGQNITEGFDRRASETTRRAIRWFWLDRDPEQPFFLFLHYFDPHSPYEPPTEFKGRFVAVPPGASQAMKRRAKRVRARSIADYDAEIAFTDSEISRLLEELQRQGLLDDTLVVVTADHGEGLMNHGVRWHGENVYEEALRVPLILRGPGVVPAGRRAKEPVALVDLAPTLLDLLEVSAGDARFDGQSLAPFLRGEAALDPDRPVFFHLTRLFQASPHGAPRGLYEQFGVRVGDFKLIDNPDGAVDEFYDLSTDPRERTNLYASRPSEAGSLRKILAEWKKRFVREIETPEIDPEVRRILEALGYVE